jgi:hypothetical protein
MCGGGMGSLVLDAPSIYVSSGSNLFAVPVAGGSPATLANDVAPFNGGPDPGPRVATDGQNVYYAAGNMMGGGQRISGVLKSATSPGSNCGTIAGTQIALAYGNVMALTLNQGDLTSDGVTPKLVVRAILLPAALGSATAVDVATLRPPTSGPSTPNPGTALVADPGSGDLYLSGFDGIYRMTCTAAGCSAPGLFVSGAVASALAVDDSYLYYGDQNSGPNGASGLKKIAK